MTRKTVCAMVLTVCLAAGCADRTSWLDEQEKSSPLLKLALSKKAEGDIQTAVKLCAQALDEDAKMARSHLELALLLHDHVHDYVGAIYHYRRYIELRPDTQKKEMLERRAKMAEQTFAVAANQGVSVAKRLESLEQENEVLRKKVAALSAEIENLRASSDSRRTVQRPPPVREPVPVEGGTTRTYKVKKNDTLTSIAAEVYKDAGAWKKIRDANKLGDSDRLTEGQVLKLP